MSLILLNYIRFISLISGPLLLCRLWGTFFPMPHINVGRGQIIKQLLLRQNDLWPHLGAEPMPKVAVAFASYTRQRIDFLKMCKFLMLVNAVGHNPTNLSYSNQFKSHFFHSGFGDMIQWPVSASVMIAGSAMLPVVTSLQEILNLKLSCSVCLIYFIKVIKKNSEWEKKQI